LTVEHGILSSYQDWPIVANRHGGNQSQSAKG